MILNKLPKRDISKKEKGKENINQAHQPSKQQPKKTKTGSINNNSNDSQNLLDWFANFPITPEMKQQDKLSTKLAQKLFFSMKTYLKEFTPGQPIKTNDQPKQNPKREPRKYSFNYLLNKIASDKPDFLVDHISDYNMALNQEVVLPFKVYLDALKNLLKNFTNILFTKLNYAKIFRSHYSIPPYSNFNRCKVAINFARLHLYLHDKYQTIDYSKFMDDLDLKPIMASFTYTTTYNEPDIPLLKIQNNNRFNIQVALNIPTNDFKNTFETPSLKPFNQTFDNWFAEFFKKYKLQFFKIDEQKTKNYIKYQIYLQLLEECKKLLPITHDLPIIYSLKQRSNETRKQALFHLHTCNQNKCILSKTKEEHNIKNLSSHYFKESFETYPVLENQPKKNWNFPELELDTFSKNQPDSATFSKPTPIADLRALANKTAKKFAKENSVSETIE